MSKKTKTNIESCRPNEKQALTGYEACKMLQVQRFIEGMGAEIDFVDGNMLSADCGSWQVFMEQEKENTLQVSFHINLNPATAGIITQKMSRLSQQMNMGVEIMESYAFEFDENGKITEVTFGEDACRSVGRNPACIHG